MSALEIIEQIKSLPPDEKAEVVSSSTRSKINTSASWIEPLAGDG